MSTFGTTSARGSREAPRVGEYRRGTRLRTTPAGTWFPASGPGDEPAGLLLVHPGVKLSVLEPTVKRLLELQIPGILPMKPDLVHQAGRNWLIATAAPNPTLADLVDGGAPAKPMHAAAVLSHLAGTLQAVHQAGVAHGLVTASAVVIGADGGALLTDWGTSESATRADDVAGWTALAELLADAWCARDDVAAAALARAANAASGQGLMAARDELRGLASKARRQSLAEVAAAMPATGGGRVPAPKAAPGGTPGPAGPPRPPRERERADDARPAAAPRRQSAPPPQPAPSSSPPEKPVPALPPVPAALGQPAPAARPRPHVDQDEQGIPALADPSGAPPPADRKPRRAWSPRWQLVLAALTLIALIVAAINLVILVNRGDSNGGPAATGDGSTPSLEIQSVVLQSQQTEGPICTLVGLVGTNGHGGPVIYRWTGGNLNLPVMTTSAPAGSERIEIGMLWSPGNSPVGDSQVTLQIIQPQPRSATVLPEPNCR